MTEALMALAMSAGSHLVTAMAEDGWQELKVRVARLLGRGDPDEEDRQAARLERSREEVVGRSGAELEQARERQAAAWRTRFEDLLEDSPQGGAGATAARPARGHRRDLQRCCR